jgi:hypothetical protein
MTMDPLFSLFRNLEKDCICFVYSRERYIDQFVIIKAAYVCSVKSFDEIYEQGLG